ncbi:MAG: CHAT domain-containing protein [Bernardetiaceae bacterium]|nr:CHAT domain-containing protein [Bernardetiaceae bacterium]
MPYSYIFCTLILFFTSFIPLFGQSPQQAQEWVLYADSLSTEKNRLEQALDFYEKAIAYYEKEAQWEDFLAVRNTQSKLLARNRRYDKAQRIAEENLQIAKERLSPNHPEAADAYNNLGIVAYYQSQYRKSADFYRLALELRENFYGSTHPEVASSRYNIGLIYRKEGAYDSAMHYFKQAEQTYEALKPEYKSNLAKVYNMIGLTAFNQNDYDESLRYYEKTLVLSHQIYEKDNSNIADAYKNIGLVHREKREYALALDFYRQAADIYARELGDMHAKTADAYKSIGTIFELTGDFDKALDFYQKALDGTLQAAGEQSEAVASLKNNLGLLYARHNQPQQSLEYLKEAQLIYAHIFGLTHPKSALVMKNIALSYKLSEDYKNAHSYLQQAIYAYRQSQGERSTDIATCLKEIASLHLLEQDWAQALSFVQRAIQHNHSSFDADEPAQNPSTIGIYDNKEMVSILLLKAEIYRTMYAQQQDIEMLKNTLRITDIADTLILNMRRGQSDKEDKIRLNAAATKIYGGGIEDAYELFVQTKKKYYIEQAFIYSERNKASVLLESISDVQAQSVAGISPDMLAQEQQLKQEITALEQLLLQAPNADEEDAQRTVLFEAKRNYEQLIKRMELEYPDYYNLKHSVAPISIADLQAWLPAQTVIMSYFLSENNEKIFCFRIERKKVSISVKQADEKLSQWIQGFRNAVNYQVPQILNFTAFALYKELFSEPLPKRCQRLIIIPDGLMSTIPFEALLTRPVFEDDENYANMPYLIKDYEVSYAYSATLLHQMQSRASACQPQSYGLLAFAPVFDKKEQQEDEDSLSPENQKDQYRRSSFDRHAIAQSPKRTSVLRSNFTPIPATEDEVNALDSLFKAAQFQSRVLLRNHAKESSLKAIENTYCFLHFATHGFINEEEPSLSGLAFSQHDEIDDGILYLGELFNLRLPARLVTLSACETGLGKVSSGEGVIGLTRALIFAGADNIVVSLWKVADASTSDLMIEFYSHILNQKQSIDKQFFATSLRAAKLKMIESGEYANPYYWSPFVLIGE